MEEKWGYTFRETELYNRSYFEINVINLILLELK